MNSGELANQVLEVCLEAQRRILQPNEYSDANDEQKYTVVDEEYLITGLEEELLDTINWAAMAIMKIRERREQENRSSA
jgi:hypothetical protein